MQILYQTIHFKKVGEKNSVFLSVVFASHSELFAKCPTKMSKGCWGGGKAERAVQSKQHYSRAETGNEAQVVMASTTLYSIYKTDPAITNLLRLGESMQNTRATCSAWLRQIACVPCSLK